MLQFVVRRLAQGVLVLAGVLTVVFFLTRLSGEPLALFVPVGASAADVERIRHELGFDRPLLVQLATFWRDVLQGDLGTSVRFSEPAFGLVLERLPATLHLTAVAMGIVVLVGIPLGILAAVKRNTAVDSLVMALAMVGQSMPTFWLGVILILVFGVALGWLPVFGYTSPAALILPGVTLGAYSVGIVARTVRSSMLEVIRQDFVRTARAKGLGDLRVFGKHALRNALIPTVTILGLQVGALLGGAIVTEFVFSFPGMARLATQAVLNRDYPVVQAFVFVTAIGVLVVNLVVDVVYAAIDPRITLG
ncbi:MAG: ABC transporter permease [Trueperaceae bacterium]|nr:ABC transporter permease [Trueperaceae bacterium]MCO5173413.1 ABC transporter permease [Trueperaceae bacterium]MCW5819249.1 ABC transporter permease [Trueperaceae bacterium]